MMSGSNAPRRIAMIPDISDHRIAAFDPNPAGEKSTPDLRLVSRWIELNRETILAFWNEDIDDDDMKSRIEPVRSSSDPVHAGGTRPFT